MVRPLEYIYTVCYVYFFLGGGKGRGFIVFHLYGIPSLVVLIVTVEVSALCEEYSLDFRLCVRRGIKDGLDDELFSIFFVTTLAEGSTLVNVSSLDIATELWGSLVLICTDHLD